MKVETGKRAVWEHAKECGLDEDIARIAKFFDIQDVSIIANGKMTYTGERPRKMYRVPAVPTGKSDVSKFIADARAEKKHFKK